MSTVATLVVALQGNIRGFTRSLDLAESRLASFGRGGGSAMAGLGISAAAAAVVVSAMSFKMAVDFESAMAGVRKTVDATEEQFAELTESIRETSRTLPFATTEIAGVAEAAGQLGVAVEDIEEFTAVMLDLGVSTNLSARDAAIGLARFTNVMDEPVERARALGDVIVALGNSTATTESEILGMATRLTGIGSTLGFTSEQILGISATMTELGIRSELGGTAFQKFAITAQKAVSEAGDDLDKFAAVAGVSATKFATMFKQDAFGALMQFVEGLGKAEERGGDQIAILDSLSLSNQRVITTLLKLANSYEQVEENVGLATDPIRTSGELALEAGRRYDTMRSKIVVAINNVKSVMIDFGDAIAPVVIGALDRVGDWFEKNGPKMRQQWDILVAGLMPVGAALLLAAEGFGSFITILNDAHILIPLVIVGLVALVVAFAPLLLVAAKFIAIGVAIGILLKVVLHFRGEIESIFNWIIGFVDDHFKAFSVIVLLFGGPAGPILFLIGAIIRFRDEIKSAFNWVKDFLVDFQESWRGTFGFIVLVVQEAINKILDGLDSAARGIARFINAVKNIGPGVPFGDVPDIPTDFSVTGGTRVDFSGAFDELFAQQKKVDREREIADFIRGLPSQQPGFEEPLDEQADVTAAFVGHVFDPLPDIFDRTAAGVDKLKAALERFLEARLESEFEAFIRGGPAAVAKLRAKNALLDAEFQKTLDAAQAFGLDVSFLHRDVFDKVIADLEQAAKSARTGDLLDFLLARRQGGLAGPQPVVLPSGASIDNSLVIEQLVVEAGADPEAVTQAIVTAQTQRRFALAGEE